jgi:regulator of sirC expression with transglutaminase-like and TPR domain
MKLLRSILLISSLFASTAQAELYVPQSDSVVYAGASVTKFRWHRSLPQWQNSRDLLAAALHHWHNVPRDNLLTISEPTPPMLEAFITKELAPKLTDNTLAVIYLGTHHLKDGRILLGERTELTADKLASWTNPLPGRKLLLIDVCYAQRFEANATFDERTVRIYASGEKERAPSVEVDGSMKSIMAFYGDTNAVVRGELNLDHEGYSLMGLEWVHTVRTSPSCPLPEIVEKMNKDLQIYARKTRRTRTPSIETANLKQWALPAAQKGKVGTDEPASEETVAALDALLAKPDDQIDIALGNLLMGKILDPEIDVDSYLKRIDEITVEVGERLKGKTSPDAAIPIINAYFYKHLKFEAVKDPYARDFLLHELLTTKKGRCSALVALYTSVAQRLDLPVVSVCVPEHIYARWKTGDTHRNIETTLKGVKLGDDRYMMMCKGTSLDDDDDFYLHAQTRKQTVATFLSALGSALREEERLKESAEMCRRAVTVNPGDAEGWNNLGMTLRLLNQPEEAKTAYDRALEIRPEFAEVWNNMAQFETDQKKRIATYRKALSYKPDLVDAWKNLFYAYMEAENYRQAWACAQQCLNRDYRLPEADLRLVFERMKYQD